MNSKFWLTVMFLMSLVGKLKATGQCHSAEYSVGGMYLRGHTFKTCRVGLPEECYFKCEEEVTCQSNNFVIGQNICELNNRTKEARPEDFMPARRKFYIKRPTNRVRLGSIKELPAESCSEIRASEGNEMIIGKYWIKPNGNSELVETNCEARSWQKINTKEPVCFGAKDNQYGAFNMTKSGRLKTMKLIHKSGYIRCHPKYSESYWGCTNVPTYGETLMTIITDAKKTAKLPPVEDLKALSYKNCTEKHFYSLDGTSHKSLELVFRNLPIPLSVTRNQEFQIWYGQDWKDCWQYYNRGKVCVDVYALYA